jgi:hypothetical protein
VLSNAKYNFYLMDRSCSFLGLRMAVDPTGALATVSSRIAAAGTFGAAAYGPVDASKAFRGGVSNAGLQSIRSIVNRLLTST